MESRTDLMRGTLDLLILRSLMTAPLHGLGIARRIAQMTQGSFDVKAGSLFPASTAWRSAACVAAEWGDSDTQRRAKFYRLTRLGRKQLQVEEANWRRVAFAMEPRARVDVMTPRVRLSAGCASLVRNLFRGGRRDAELRADIDAYVDLLDWTRRSPPVCRPRRRGGRAASRSEASMPSKTNARSVRAGALLAELGRTRAMRCA